MPLVLSVAAAMVTFSVWGADAEVRCDVANLTDALALGKPELPIWVGLQRLRSLSSNCGEGSSRNMYWPYLAQIESYVGNHALALTYFNKLRQSDRAIEHSSFPAGIRAVAAVDYIARRARDHRIVILNERHHASPDRLLTMNLLEPLAALGFRYLALETASTAGDPINERGYPVRESGYYTNDVVFGELVRNAIDSGFEIITYEIEGDQWQGDKDNGVTDTYRARREYWQGRNIADRVISRGPDAKVLVHCGWGHVRESGSSHWPLMAEVLGQLTDLDPLTVDQTVFADYGNTDHNHPLRTVAEKRNLAGDAEVVLLAEDGAPTSIGDPTYVDIHVLGRRTQYDDGRPTWMGMDGRRQAVEFATPECESRPCVVEARSTRYADAVAFDRVEVDGAKTTLYVPPGREVTGHIFRLDGSEIAQREVATATDSRGAQSED